MFKLSNRNKIYALCAGWLIATGLLFWYGFPALEVGNLDQANQVLAKSKQYQDLQQQEASFQAGKKDLETLKFKPYQPTDFFSQDTSLVKEIETLENLAKLQNLSLELQVTGTKAAAAKAPTVSDIGQIPYTLSLTGKLSDVAAYLQYMENLKFITQSSQIDISSLKDSQVKATLSAVFFVQK